jgi:hypothetical protein
LRRQCGGSGGHHPRSPCTLVDLAGQALLRGGVCWASSTLSLRTSREISYPHSALRHRREHDYHNCPVGERARDASQPRRPHLRGEIGE